MLRLLSFLLIFHYINCVPRVDPLVDTKQGLIRGLRSDNGEYSMFLGVPYGLLDEANPFGPSIPHPGFNTTFEAYDDSTVCPQAINDIPMGKIQCLNLNIFVPNKASSQNRLPVMVWIHGGAFIEGSGARSMNSPNFLIKHDILFVSINYRLGLYGFTCTDSAKAPGNAGLKDQLLALRWINENIAAFGGDVSKITIFGESAGAMSVHLHLLSDFERLFDKAIIQSGPSSSPWTVVDRDNSVPLRVAENLGFVTDNVDDALDFISRTDVELAIAAANQMRATFSVYSNEPLTKPCVEQQFEDVERFIAVHPNVARSSKARTTPIIFGFNSQELIFQHRGKSSEFFSTYSFRDLMQFGFDVTNLDDNMVDKVRHFYIGDESPGNDLIDDITDFASDFVFNHPTERAISLLLEDQAKLYHFVFSYEGERGFGMNRTLKGAAHGEDLGYLFDMDIFAGQITEEDQLTIDRMTQMWTNFAKYGDPTPETTETVPVKWEPVTDTNRFYLNIDIDLTLERRPFHNRMAFWDLFYKLNENTAKGFGQE